MQPSWRAPTCGWHRLAFTHALLLLLLALHAHANRERAILDEEARRQYRARVLELEEDLEEAESWNDPARADRARQELDFIQQELSQAVGLGGRERKVGSAAERARVNVQRRIRDAIRRIESHHPGLAKHLARSVRTGTYCAYEP